MTRFSTAFWRFSLVLAFALSLSTWPSAAEAQVAGVGPPSRIVVLRDGVDAVKVSAEHAARLGLKVSHVYTAALSGYAAPISRAGARALRRDPRVKFVSRDRPVHAIAQTVPTGIDRIEAEPSKHPTPPSAPAVAVIDTGSGPHPDLNVVGGVDCVLGLSFNDDNGHGSHVAGTIGALNNAEGVVGVAPGAPIYSVKTLTAVGVGLTSQIICGIDWVTANAAAKNIKVASMSLGGGGGDDGNCGNTNRDAMHLAICRSVAAGVTYVVAAGNDGSDLSGTVPASYDEVLTVAAMSDSDGQPGGTGGPPSCRTSERDDSAASFSNWAAPGSADANHTIAAPGVCILSTSLLGGYATLSGTSMATPHVSGAAALCLSSPPPTGCAGMTPSQVAAKLRQDAQNRANSAGTPYYGFAGDPNSPIAGHYYGYLVYTGAY
ncbi:MAG TPA: S8 family serine peptidase [Chloroflexota bacterium]|jgi:subtilisin family serine protease